MAIESSLFERERLALERAVEEFRARAVQELQVLADGLRRSAPAPSGRGTKGPATSSDAWEQARRRHRLARRGLIPWLAEPVPPSSPVVVLRDNQRAPEPRHRPAAPRAA